MNTLTNIKKYQRQNGAALIVSLVILTLVTVLGLASMRNSNLELKMATSAREYNLALQNAETALRIIEQRISANPFTKGMVATDSDGTSDCVPGDDVDCFNPSCINGLCFDGVWELKTQDALCDISQSENGEPPRQMWKVQQVWEDELYHQTIDIPSSRTPDEADTDIPVQYVVEFLCTTLNQAAATSELDRGFPLYRITVRAGGEMAGRSVAMLQSVYRGSFMETAGDEIYE